MYNKYKATKLIFIFFIGLSMMFFLIGIFSLYINIHKVENCTEKVIAVCTRIKTSSGTRHNRHKRTYRYVFSYEYDNKKYEITYGKVFSKNNKDVFEKEKEYTIFVNPKYPSQFIIEGHENDIDSLAIAAPIIGGCLTIFYLVIYFIFKKHYNNSSNECFSKTAKKSI